jgi:hypothetical protein
MTSNTEEIRRKVLKAYNEGNGWVLWYECLKNPKHKKHKMVIKEICHDAPSVRNSCNKEWREWLIKKFPEFEEQLKYKSYLVGLRRTAKNDLPIESDGVIFQNALDFIIHLKQKGFTPITIEGEQYMENSETNQCLNIPNMVELNAAINLLFNTKRPKDVVKGLSIDKVHES